MPLDKPPQKGSLAFSTSLKRPLATAAVVAGLLASAAPASAGTFVGNPSNRIACDGIGAVVDGPHDLAASTETRR